MYPQASAAHGHPVGWRTNDRGCGRSRRFAADSGVEISTLPFVMQPGTRSASSRPWKRRRGLRHGERFDLRVSIDATQAMPAPACACWRIGKWCTKPVIASTRAIKRSVFRLTAAEPGFTRYVVQIDPPQDQAYQNNELAAIAQVLGEPKVLVVSPPEGSPMPNGETRPAEVEALLRALQATDFNVETARPAQLPSDVATLADYASVVLVDVPARELSTRQMEALRSYVRELGGGSSRSAGRPARRGRLFQNSARRCAARRDANQR